LRADPKHPARDTDNSSRDSASRRPDDAAGRREAPQSIERTALLPSKTMFLHHVRWLRAAAKAAGAELLVELDSMAAYLRKGDRHWVLLPKFISEVDGSYRYFGRLPDGPTIFGGWMFNPPPGWPATRDKLVFKRAVASHGLLVPETSFGEAGELADVVVKRPDGSFGEDVHGPYRSSRQRPLRVEHGEFYERFLQGEIVKAWYWAGQAVVLECEALPTVTGDGRSTLRELITERALRMAPSPARLASVLARSADMLAYDGARMDDVPPAGAVHRVEFRYGTDLATTADRRQADLRGDDAGEWQALKDAAPIFASLVPAALREVTMFAIDAIRTPDGRLHFLEMNGNPAVHPLLYGPMVSTLVANPRTGILATPPGAAVATA
jgi:hypothetical protein